MRRLVFSVLFTCLLSAVVVAVTGREAGEGFFLQGKWHKAIEAYKAIGEPSQEDLLRLADAYFYSDNYSLAEKTYMRLKDSPEARISIAMLSAIEKKKNIDLLKELFTLWPDNPRLWRAVGIALMRNRDDKTSLYYFQGATVREPNDYMSYFYMGSIYETHHAFDEAIPLYKKVIELNPLYAQAVNNLGYVYKERHYYSYAIEMYKKAVELDPENAGFHYNLGVAYTRKDMIKEAFDCHKRAVELEPTFAKAHYNIGRAYYKLGKNKEWPEMGEFYKKGLEHFLLYIKYWSPSISPVDVPLPEAVEEEIKDLRELINIEEELAKKRNEKK